MMDDADYCERHRIKRMIYERAGIVPWRNIIYLYATGDRINMQSIDAAIRGQVMEWL